MMTIDFDSCYDISPTLSEATAVFPGDKPFTRQQQLSWDRGDHLCLSSFQSTVHIGAHADAPIHYHPQGDRMDEVDFRRYAGPCQVVHIKGHMGQSMFPDSLAATNIQAPRVLFATNSFPNPDHWNADFTSLSAALVDDLAQQGVVLVGIDTPSVDPADSKQLLAHQALYRNSLAVLEGLVLRHVPEGLYHLLALPLRLAQADASPVRAVLFEGTFD